MTTATTNNTEIEVVVLTDDQIDTINELAQALLEATTSEDILTAMGNISKLHRRISKPVSEAQVTIREDGTKLVGATATIICSECQAEHIVKVQDVHQVSKCPACQKTHRNAKRAEKRKDKRAEIKAQKDADQAIADQLLADYKAKLASEAQA